MPRHAASSSLVAALPMRAHAAGVRAGQDRIGAAAIISAVLQYYMNFMPRSGSRDVDSFLLAAASVGALCKKNASISGAEVGRQVEVGSACAMASVKATNAAQLTLRGDGAHAISLGQVIPTVNDTGRDVLDKYKETSRGGLAASLPEF
nr:L-serine ammonia-lyase, iron-sulfur-dependent, subunit alpha [Rhodoferax sp. U2-2l]